jgi:dipeptidyl aminopeptidase/acylaminoacyl peptidase
MQRITWYALLAVAALLAPIAGEAQAPKAADPQPNIKEIATIPGVEVQAVAKLPSGRIVIYVTDDERRPGIDQLHSIKAYDLVTKRSTFITSVGDEVAVSPAGDRIAFSRASETGDDFIWSMPIDPVTGAASGPAQRVSLNAGDTPSFSPDGKLIAFCLYSQNGNTLAVVPATGGPERRLARYTTKDNGNIFDIWWSDDAKSLFVRLGARPPRSIDRVPAAGGRSQTVFTYPGRGAERIEVAIAFYRPDSRAQSEGRIAYVTAAGARGEFRIPPGAEVAQPGLGTTLPRTTLLTVADTLQGQPAAKVYELDVSPILQSLGIR